MAAATPWIDWPLRAVLLPVLAAQGVHVRRTARTLQEPPGARSGAIPGARTHLLILGDSSAAGVGCADQSQALGGQLPQALAPNLPVTWTVLARCGDRTRDALDRLSQPDAPTCDIAVTALGVNDVTKATPRHVWRRQQAHMLDKLRTLGARHVFVCALPPMGHFPLLPNPLRWVLGRQAQAFDETLQTLAVERSYVTHVPFDVPLDVGDMAADGYHPGPKVYAAWAQHLARRITATL